MKILRQGFAFDLAPTFCHGRSGVCEGFEIGHGQCCSLGLDSFNARMARQKTSDAMVSMLETAVSTGETSQRNALYIRTGNVVVSGPVMK
ncbi:hypothetical protein D3C85_1577200 [compost metagenome]